MRKTSILLVIFCLSFLISACSRYNDCEEEIVGIQLIDKGSKARLYLLNRQPVKVLCSGIVFGIRSEVQKLSDYPMLIGLGRWQFSNEVYKSAVIVYKSQDQYDHYFKSAVENYRGEDDVGDCFIATAAYGTPLHQDIYILRNFRDTILVKNWLGEKFVNWYYDNGPIMAEWIEESSSRKVLVRSVIVKPSVFVLKTNVWQWCYAFALSLMLCLVLKTKILRKH